MKPEEYGKAEYLTFRMACVLEIAVGMEAADKNDI